MLNPEAVNAYVNLHKELKMPFTMAISNYTTRIKSNYIDIHFMRNEQSNRVFAAYSKVKSQVLKKPLPEVNKKKLQYYSHSFKEESFYMPVIYNCDLKSAYANVLFNDGYIDKETFKYLTSLPKMQRLAAVGMLAGKKNIFEIDENGDIESQREEIAPTSDYFFHCVKRISETINEASQYLGEAFLFSWVDGIYFFQEYEKGAETAGKIINDFFQEKGFQSSFDILKDFKVTAKENYFLCSYKKDEEGKIMRVPRHDITAIRKITDYLTKKK